jgi:hypothetical protein
MRTDAGWDGYSYEWNAEQTEAVLLEGSKTVTLDNGVRWTYPSRSACFECHTEAAGITLGLEATQLAWPRAFGDGEEPVDQLAWLVDHDYLRPSVESRQQVLGDRPPLVDPFGEGPLEPRVKSYLHANCSQCHRPGAPSPADIDLRFETELSRMKVCGAEPQSRIWDVEAPWEEQQIVTPGNPSYSTLYLRMSLLGFFRMPPIATERLDERAVDLMERWIAGLESCP